MLAGVLCLVAGSVTVHAQSPRALRFENLSDRYTGAPSSVVTAIVQDKQGFIWIGAQYGAYRHDGHRSVIYQHDPADPHSLPGNYVMSMFRDKHDRLWLGTNNGLALYDPEIDGFDTYRAGPDPSEGKDGTSASDVVARDSITGIVDDGAEGLWLGSRQGLQHFDPAGGRFERYLHDASDPGSLGSDRIDAIVRDAKGGVWAGVWGAGIDYLAPGGKHFEHFRLDDPGHPDAKFNSVTALLIDSGQRLWIGSETGVQLWQPGSAWNTRESLPAPAGHDEFWVFGIYQDPHGTMWLATQPTGLLQWDSGTHSFISYIHQPADQHSLSSNRIYSVLVDRSDTLWVGSRDQGIGRADLASDGFARFMPEADAPNSPDALNAFSMGNVVDSMSPAGGSRVWLGGPGGLRLYDTATRHIVKSYRHEPGKSGTLSSNYVVGLWQQTDGPLWVATSEGLNRLDSPDGAFHEIHFPQKEVNAIRQITPARGGALWMGTDAGVVHYDPASGASRIIPFSSTPVSGSGNDSVGILLEDRRGRLWVGDPHGLGVDVLDPASGKFVNYRHDDRVPDSMPNDFVRCLYEDKDGGIWIGTLEGLIQVVEGSDGRLRFRAVGDKRLASVYIESIETDNSGMLWAAGAIGTGEAALISIDPVGGNAKYYLASDGINGGDFYDGATMRGADGTLYFGSMQGFTSVRAQDVRINSIPPEVKVVDLTVSSRSLSKLPRPQHLELEGTVNDPKRLTLPWDEATFSVEFTATHYADPERNRYMYRLDGFDSGWIAADAAHRVATYTNLAPGSYLFHVKAANKNGVWGEPGLQMQVVVPPPFWATWWFRLLVAAVAVGTLALIYRARIAQLNRRQLELELLVRERTGELARKNAALSEAYGALENLSVTDPLTGLGNRRFLEQKLPGDLLLTLRRYETAGAETPPNAAILFFLVDLDHFKQVNDRQGHAAGDQVLVEVARRLQDVFRDSDYLVRWGGEEFLAVVRDTDVAQASHLAERVRTMIGDTDITLDDGNTIRQTCSIGYASFPFSPIQPRLLSWQQVVKLADLGLYAAKRSGRAAWVGLTCGAIQVRAEQVDQMLQTPDVALQAGTLKLHASVAQEDLVRNW